MKIFTFLRSSLPLILLLGGVAAYGQINMKWFHSTNVLTTKMREQVVGDISSGYDMTSGVSFDKDGFSYVTGTWSDTTQSSFGTSWFGPVKAERRQDIFVRKVGPTGAIIWEVPIAMITNPWSGGGFCFKCPGSQPLRPEIYLARRQPIAVSDDFIFIAGYIRPGSGGNFGESQSDVVDVSFGTTTGAPHVAGSYSPLERRIIRGFIAKYTLSGQFVEAQMIFPRGGAGTTAGQRDNTYFSIESIAVGTDQDIFVSGEMVDAYIDMDTKYSASGGMAADGVSGRFTVPNKSIYVSRYDRNNMNWRWTSCFQSSLDFTVRGLTSEGNEVFASGGYWGTISNWSLYTPTSSPNAVESKNLDATTIASAIAAYDNAILFNLPVTSAMLSALEASDWGFPLSTTVNEYNAYAVKMNGDGRPSWFKSFGDADGDERGGPITIKQGNIYHVLDINWRTETSPNVEIPLPLPTAPNPRDVSSGVCINKVLNTSVNRLEWVYFFRGANNTAPIPKVTSIAVSGEQELYIGGYFSDVLDADYMAYDGGPNSWTYIQPGILFSIGSDDGFVLKVNSNKYRAWAIALGGAGVDEVRGLSAYEKDLLVGGGYSQSVDFQPSSMLVSSQVSAGYSDAYAALYGCYDVKIQTPSTQVCQGDVIQLTILPDCPSGCNYTYVWQTPQGTQTTTSTIFAYSGILGTNTLLLTATESNSGCVVSASVDITVNPAVTLDVTPQTVLLCNGTPSTFSATASSGAVIEWYDNSNSLVAAGNNFTTATPGIYKAIAEANGCRQERAVVYNQYTSLSPNVLPFSPQLCFGSTVPLQVTGCAGCSFSWNVPLGSTASSNGNTILVDIPGYYEAVMTDANGCTYVEGRIVGVGTNLNPVLEAVDVYNQPISTICNGNPVILRTPYLPNYSYQWSNGSTTPFTVAFASGNYQVTVIDNFTGCSGVTQNIFVQTSTVQTPAVVGNPGTICSPGNALLTVTNPCANCSYTWRNNGNPNTPIPFQVGFNFTATATGDYFAVVQDSFGCRANSNLVNVGNGAATAPLISGTTGLLCGNNESTLSTPVCNGCTYEWRRNGSAIPGANQPTHTTNVLGSYSVAVTYSNGCSALSAPFTLGVHPAFNPSIQPLFPTHGLMCNGNQVQLGITGVTAAQFPPAWQYQWYFNGAPISGSNGINHYAQSPGIYYLEVTNENGCTRITNSVPILYSDTAANPLATPSPNFVCNGTNTTIQVNTCPGCSYQWYTASNTTILGATTNSITTPVATGYYVQVSSPGGCTYNSNLVDIRDSVLTKPVVNVSTDPICSPGPVILSTPSCIGCNFLWIRQDSTGTVNDTVQANSPLNTYTATTAGFYIVRVTTADGCTNVSNPRRVTFSTVNAQLLTPPSTTICNSVAIPLQAIPIDPTYRYYWYRNNGLLALADTLNQIPVTQPGDYHVVIRNAEGCPDTSSVMAFISANNVVDIQPAATVICDTNYQVQLSVTPCSGCTYQWFLSSTPIGATGGFPIAGATGPIHTVNGFAGAGWYRVDVNKNGCIAWDTVQMAPVGGAPFSVLISSSGDSGGSICDGAEVTLTSNCPSCQHQWFANGAAVAAPLGQLPSLLTDTAASYYVRATNAQGCIDTSQTLAFINVNPPANFALDFDTLSVLPISFGIVDMRNYLRPTSVHPGQPGIAPSSTFSSFTIAPGTGFSGLGNSFLNPLLAGSGFHIIRYTYTQSNCTYWRQDTIQILNPISIGVTNLDTVAPQYEACVGDTMRVQFNNFTFAPTQIILSAGGTDTVRINITPSLTFASGVWNGFVNIRIPSRAKTGKLIATNGTAAGTYETPYFVVIRNPEITMSLNGAPTPICSNGVPITLFGSPSGGLFRAAYSSDTATFVPSLLSGADLLPANIGNYNLLGQQNLQLSYWYAPTYTNTSYVCSDTLITRINVPVRDVRLDSVFYTPISLAQQQEAMENLTLLVYPLQTRFYTSTYIGTYISNDTILPSSISTGPGNQPVTYRVLNDGCSNQREDSLAIWPAPNMNPIPKYICRQDPIIRIFRNATGIFYTVGGVTSAPQDTHYIYRTFNSPANPNFSYSEQRNLMEVLSSSGGLTAVNVTPGVEEYWLDPMAISGNSTTLTIRYRYNRTHTYFTPSTSTTTTNYIIAEISKDIFIEEPFTAQISPAIVAHPIFCQENVTMQFSGIPTGPSGIYYVDGVALFNNVFNPINFAVGTHSLKYVYTGLACRDSAEITILIPQPFSISIAAPTGPEYCTNDPNEPIGFNVFGIPASAIDSSSGLFYIGGIQSGSIFSPSQLGAGIYPVTYSIADTFGCRESADSVFIVHNIPSISMTNLAPEYCLNSMPIPIDLFHGAANISSAGYPTGGTATLTGTRLQGAPLPNNPANPVYIPSITGIAPGMDTLTFTYTDSNACTNSIQDIVKINPLPVLSMTTLAGTPILPEYCEGTVVHFIGLPFGGDWDVVSTTNPAGSNLDTVNNIFTAYIADNFVASTSEVFQYAYTDPATLCRDTIYDSTIVYNYTVSIAIALDTAGLNNNNAFNNLCSYDVDWAVNPVQTIYTGGGITNGTFSFSEPTGFAQTGPLAAVLHPDTVGIFDVGKNVTIRFAYLDGICPDTAVGTFFIHPVPRLTYTLPGSRWLGSTSMQQHTCYEFTANEAISVRNQYMGVTSNVTTAGTYLSGDGVIVPNGTQYNAVQAGPGMDVIAFTYTHPTTGCMSTITDSIMVDTVPPLDMIGYPVGLTDPYTYCANDPTHLVIPSPFGGTMYFNGSTVPGNVFTLHPGTLAAPTPVDTTHRLAYVYIAARYMDGRICVDSTADTILIHPTPVLQMAAAIPSEYCLGSDTLGYIVLNATPAGGVFEDITSVTLVNGIVQDTIFNAMAQLGDRTILYWYEEPTTGCRDSITHLISVYRVPHVGFSSGGGCIGSAVQFNPDSTLLSNTLPARDSLTSIVWDFGDGNVVSVSDPSNPTVVPVITHTYANPGVYFPVLTLVNRGGCDTSYMSRVVISPRVTVTAVAPYFEDFQDDAGGWMQEQANVVGVPQDTTWEWGMANGQRINTVFFENNVWVTRRDHPYKKGENAWVYSPCFDISDLRRPMISMDIWRNSRQGVDGAVLEYFDTVGQTWNVLGYRSKGINWYNPPFVIAGPGNQSGAPIGWSGVINNWENARYRLDATNHDLRNRRNVRFRLAFASSPNTIVDGMEGFAFDNVFIGNRTRSILVEHFSNVNYTGIQHIEPPLYAAIYNNLYGRDVSLIQYHIEIGGTDPYYNYNQGESNARRLFYSIETANKVRLNGQNLVATTQDLVQNQLDLLDKEMLKDPAFSIRFLTPPQFVITGNQMNLQVEVKANDFMPLDEYSVQVVLTEDSVRNQVRNYSMRAVMRDMLETAAGTEFAQAWQAGDVVTVQQTKSIQLPVKPEMSQVVIFVQNMRTKEVYQVATTRNLTIYNGPIPSDVEEVAGEEIADMVLFPNPAEDYFNVRFSEPLKTRNEWQLFDMTGRILQAGIIEAGNDMLTVYTEQLAGGMYIFSVKNENVYTQRKVVIGR